MLLYELHLVVRLIVVRQTVDLPPKLQASVIREEYIR